MRKRERTLRSNRVAAVVALLAGALLALTPLSPGAAAPSGPTGASPVAAAAAGGETTLTARAIPATVTYPRPVVLRASLTASGAVLAESNAAVIAIARKQLGKPYVYGASGPKAFDCSGLVMYCYSRIGIELPHSSSMQAGSGTRVPRSALAPGDLVFFYRPIHHVGLYIGNDMFIHAPRTGDVVKISRLSARTNFTCAVRLTHFKLGVSRSQDGGVTWRPDGAALWARGAWTATRRVRAKTLFRIGFAGTDEYLPSVSRVVTVTVRPLITAPAIRPAVVRGTTVTASGVMTPAQAAGVELWVYRLAQGHWTRETTVAASSSLYRGTTRYRARLHLARAGRRLVRAHFSGDADHEAATGPGRRFFVR